MKELKNIYDLLFHEIQVLYAAEELLIAGITRMMGKAKDDTLKAAFKQHLAETKVHKERLEEVAKHLGIEVEGDGNPSMKGLIAEGEKVMHKDATHEALDAALIAGTQKIEHYEISGYGTAAHYAKLRGLTDIAKVLRQTLEEEQATDTKLNNLAKSTIYRKAQLNYQE